MIKELIDIVGVGNIKQEFDLKNCSSFGIGGCATFYATPDTIDGLFDLISFAEINSIRYKVIGNATNLLFSDDGFDGLVISTRKIVNIVLGGENIVLASAGAALASVLNFSKTNSLSGLEFAVGIPGSVGGAIVMNAGAGDGDISKVIKSVTVIENGDIRVLEKNQLDFGYRSSYFNSHKNAVILFAEFELINTNDISSVNEKIQANLEKRRQTQPQAPSAGCVFKKCGETPAGLLIDQAGLKGLRVGGAMVSDIHANFIVNTGQATSKDVKKLIGIIKSEVWAKFNKSLELEIELID